MSERISKFTEEGLQEARIANFYFGKAREQEAAIVEVNAVLDSLPTSHAATIILRQGAIRHESRHLDHQAAFEAHVEAAAEHIQALIS